MTGEAKLRPIVYIEDSDEDYEVAVWAFRQAGVQNPIVRCPNAAAINDLLTERHDWDRDLNTARPLFVLLDLNLPGSDGRDTLQQLRACGQWQSVPVIVLSTSKHPTDVATCYRHGAAGYVHKALDLDNFAAVISRLAAYWLDTVELPSCG